jgi:uncharacterized protein YciI
MSLSKILKATLTALCLTTAAIAPTAVKSAPAPTPMTLVIYEAGSAWKQGEAPEKQNLGPHFGYVGELFKAGKIVAFGPQTDAVRSYYILKGAEPAIADEFVKNDPGFKEDIFKPVAELGWAVAVNAFQPNMKDHSYFILRYKPGSNWVAGKTVAEQDIGAHFGYMIEQSKIGVVLAAGPAMAGDEGLYVVQGSRADIDKLVAADPGVTAGIFAPQIFGWNVLGMQAAQ